jgi:hypothetical protein
MVGASGVLVVVAVGAEDDEGVLVVSCFLLDVLALTSGGDDSPVVVGCLSLAAASVEGWLAQQLRNKTNNNSNTVSTKM